MKRRAVARKRKKKPHRRILVLVKPPLSVSLNYGIDNGINYLDYSAYSENSLIDNSPLLTKATKGYASTYLAVILDDGDNNEGEEKFHAFKLGHQFRKLVKQLADNRVSILNVYVHVHVCLVIHVHVCLVMHGHVHVCLVIHVHVCLVIHVHVHVCLVVHVHVCLVVYVHVHNVR